MTQGQAAFVATCRVKSDSTGIRSVEAAGMTVLETEPGAGIWDVTIKLLIPINIEGGEPRIAVTWKDSE